MQPTLPCMLMLVWLPGLFSSPLLPDLLGAVRDLGPQLPQLLQTVVTGGGAAAGGAGAVTGGASAGGAVTGVTTLPAVTTMTATPVMATMAPGIALGILKALLVGRSTLSLLHLSL